jgi:hypothetical protein
MKRCIKCFFEDVVLYIYKGYKTISITKYIWLKRLVLCQCPWVSFPFQVVIVDEAFLVMVKKP